MFATGLVSPNPTGSTLVQAVPWAMSQRATAIERFSERAWLADEAPSESVWHSIRSTVTSVRSRRKAATDARMASLSGFRLSLPVAKTG